MCVFYLEDLLGLLLSSRGGPDTAAVGDRLTRIQKGRRQFKQEMSLFYNMSSKYAMALPPTRKHAVTRALLGVFTGL